MKRIMDTIEVSGRFFEDDDETVAMDLNCNRLSVTWIGPSGGRVGVTIPRPYAMQVVRTIAEQIEVSANDIVRDSSCDFDSLGSYVDAKTLDAPINVAFACPGDPDEWPKDEEEIVGAEIGGGLSSIVAMSMRDGTA